MKTLLQITILGLALTTAAGLQARTAEATNSVNTAAMIQPASEDLGWDLHEGKSNKIARVYSVTPAYVQVIYDGGKGGRKIPRNDLPPQLRARYPYDAPRAAEYQAQKAEIAVNRATAVNDTLRENLKKQEDTLMAEINRLGEKDSQMQREVNALRKAPPGGGRKVKLAHLMNQQQQLREHVQKLQSQLDAVRARRLVIP
ncbi:MAG TPA: hypothetical protein PKA41_04885 [Verrucomicrobiota bacterium]|nr:hypothetical protein [Verrucomicrobiota bacterium]